MKAKINHSHEYYSVFEYSCSTVTEFINKIYNEFGADVDFVITDTDNKLVKRCVHCHSELEYSSQEDLKKFIFPSSHWLFCDEFCFEKYNKGDKND